MVNIINRYWAVIKKILMIVVLLTLAVVGYKILQPKNLTSNSVSDVATDTSTGVAFTSDDPDNITPTYVDSDPNSTSTLAVSPVLKSQPAAPRFSCDSRKHCSQMTSCAEATYFTNNCPNTKMDGNNDGIPCEKQWCNWCHQWFKWAQYASSICHGSKSC